MHVKLVVVLDIAVSVLLFTLFLEQFIKSLKHYAEIILTIVKLFYMILVGDFSSSCSSVSAFTQNIAKYSYVM